MTPRVTPQQLAVGDRVQDARWAGTPRGGRGRVVAVYADTARIRWDRGGNEGVRALAFLRKMDEP